MNLDRRTVLAGTAAALASPPLFAKARPGRADWYDRSIIIDGLGGFGDPNAPDGVSRYTDRGWADTENADPSYVWVTMRRLRQKIEPDPNRPAHVVTIRGVGYRLVTSPDRAPEAPAP